MHDLVSQRDEALRLGDKDKAEKLREQYMRVMDKRMETVPKANIDPMEEYYRLGGEAEARLTQSRMSMDAAQRAAQYPWQADYFQQATGVPLNGLLFRYD